jgi:hypothetical protein
VRTSVCVSGRVGRNVVVGFGRWDTAEAVHEAVVVVPVRPRRGELLKVGQGGERSALKWGALAHAFGLVQADGGLGEGVVESPTLPIEGVSPASRRVSPKRTAVYCEPASEWWMVSPASGCPCRPRKVAAWRIADSTNVVCLLREHSQPTMRPAKASITNAV